MMVMTMPWHWVGLLGQPRRMAYFDFSNPALSNQGWTLVAGTLGGLMLVLSALLFIYILARAGRSEATPAPYTFSTPVHMPAHSAKYWESSWQTGSIGRARSHRR